LIPETNTDCFAWALLDNHAHMLLRTGSVAGSVFMNRLLTGYAGWFNRKYRRHGPLLMSTIEVARRLKISQPAASRLSKRGERIEKKNRFDLIADRGFKT
jgi:hypothetical protein